MKSILSILAILFFSGANLQAQTSETLIVKSEGKGLYVDHKVAPKENFYSIGRLFNVHPKHIASFNSLDMSKGLSIGQGLKIPLSDTNFNQKTSKGIPVYYVTGNSETLSKVSISNKNVSQDNLRKWNHLSKDIVTPGSKLVVGYLTSNEVQASTAVVPVQKTEPENKPATESKKEVVKNEIVNGPEEKKADEGKQLAQKKEELRNELVTQPAVKAEEEKKTPVVEQKVEQKPANNVVQVKQEVKQTMVGQGYFRSSFEQQVKQQPITKEQTVTAGIFKTSSGWSDAKYYLLMDGAEPGTIVRITNPSNNKMIYAKLLGEMNGLKQNQGLNIRISNAAADALDIAETDKFIVKLNY